MIYIYWTDESQEKHDIYWTDESQEEHDIYSNDESQVKHNIYWTDESQEKHDTIHARCQGLSRDGASINSRCNMVLRGRVSYSGL